MNKMNDLMKETMNGLKTWARVNSPWVLHFNSGSCNGCDIEILATLTPRFDVERFGIKLQASPRQADILLCTGPVTRQARERLSAHLRANARTQVRGGHWFLRHYRVVFSRDVTMSWMASTRSSP